MIRAPWRSDAPDELADARSQVTALRAQLRAEQGARRAHQRHAAAIQAALTEQIEVLRLSAARGRSGADLAHAHAALARYEEALARHEGREAHKPPPCCPGCPQCRPDPLTRPTRDAAGVPA